MQPVMILDCTLAFLAFINPISKIFVISTLEKEVAAHTLRHIAIKASLIALAILIVFMFAGTVLLQRIFHVDIYAFKIAGGSVLFWRGLLALNKGLFFEITANQKLEDLSIVPLASPMIAGPAAITAAVSFPATYGIAVTAVGVICAVGVTFGIMLMSRWINRLFSRYNITGALIRITGLIVATIGVQMVLDGIKEFTFHLF